MFSEIYYGDGWQAYLNGAPVVHQQVNYVLRGMQIPPGSNTIEFKFEPEVVQEGSIISLTSSIALLILLGLGLFRQLRNPKENS